MRRFKYLLLLIISFFLFNRSVFAASSNFEAFILPEMTIDESQITVTLGYSGEEVMAVKNTITYASDKLELVDIIPMDNFVLTKSEEATDGKYKTITILADSDYSFNDSKYCDLVFKVKDKFKINNKTDVFLYNFNAAGPEKIKFRSSGLIVTLNRKSTTEMNYVTKLIDKNTKTQYWFINHAYIFIIILLAVIFIIIIILILPSRRKKEIRDKVVEENIKSENFDPNFNNVKIDIAAIDKIGVKEEPRDMSEAIIVNEDIKPFGDIVGRYEEDKHEDITTYTAQEINIFASRTPDEVDKLNLPANSENTSPQSPKTLPNNKEVETLEQFRPKEFEEVEMPKLNESINLNPELPKEPPIEVLEDNNKTNLFSIIILGLLIISSFSTKILADEVEDIRAIIVGQKKTDKTYDYNEDGIVDLLDLLETKNLENCVFDELVASDPGFKELHGNSNNIIKPSDKVIKPTKKAAPNGTTSTSKKSLLTTKKKTEPGFKTSTKTTEKQNPEDKTTTIRTTSTKNPSGPNNPTTTTNAPTYNVSITTQNGSSSPSSLKMKEGEYKRITLNPYSGYTLDLVKSSCKNISYASDGNRLVLSGIKGDATCNLVFSPKSNIKVTLRIKTGKGNSSYNTPTISYDSTSKDNGGNGIYNQEWAVGVPTPQGYKVKGNPTCGQYSNNKFSITIPSQNQTCELSFDPILYKFDVYLPNQASSINTGTYTQIFYNESKEISFVARSSYSKVKCSGGTSPSLHKESIGNGLYEYSFTYQHKNLENAVCNLS